jgi:lysophospholipase L1-like esterase
MRPIPLTLFLFIFLFFTSFMEPVKHTMLCLGDSYTIGEAVEEAERFPMQTVALLKARGIFFEKPLIIARTGWTTDELAAAIKEAELKHKFDFVTLLIGVNNQYRGRDTANYRSEFRELLSTAIDYAGVKPSHVFVLSIPDWGVTPFGAKDKRREAQIEKEIDLFNSINKEETLQAKAHHIDITPASRKAKNDAALLAGDGLHPSGKMYREWAEKLGKDIEREIANKK